MINAKKDKEKSGRVINDDKKGKKKSKTAGATSINSKRMQKKHDRNSTKNTAFEGNYNNIMKLQCVHAI